jgi:site-specific recombinase XerD
MAHLLYGSGLRVMECVRLRVKDVDLGYMLIALFGNQSVNIQAEALKVATDPNGRRARTIASNCARTG